MMRKLTALELLVMHLINGKTKGTVLSKKVWPYIYPIDPMTILKNLIKDGVILEDSNLMLTLSKLKKTELIEILKLNNLRINGNKKDLVLRLIENDANLSSVYLPEVYTINNEYVDVYKETEFLLEFIHGIDISIEDAYRYYITHPGISEFDLKVGIYSDRIKYWLKSDKYTSIYQIKSLCFTLSEIYFQYKEYNLGFYYLNIAYLIHISFLLRKYILNNEFYNAHINMPISSKDIIKYRSAIANNIFTLSQLEYDLKNAIKPFEFSNKVIINSVNLMLAIIQDEFVNPKAYTKGLSKEDFENGWFNKIKLEMN